MVFWMKTYYPSHFYEANISIEKSTNYKSSGNGLIHDKLIQAKENNIWNA